MTMHPEKKRRLESKGWNIGGADELLSLSRDEAAAIEIRLRLADGLKRRRRVALARTARST